MVSCKIQWIDKQGNTTADSNRAIQLARTIKRATVINGLPVQFEASEWFPICAEHSKRLSEPGMHIWETKPLEDENG